MAQAVAALPSDVSARTRPTTVLVVDDEDGIRRLFDRLLTRQGYVVETASDGQSALAAAARIKPDVVLLDVMMPGLNGFEVCRRLKRDPATRLTPVILVTGMTGHEQRVESASAGADDFLAKPVEMSELLARIESVASKASGTSECRVKTGDQSTA